MNKPSHKDYLTDSGLHAAMSAYARSLDRPNVVASLSHSDGTEVSFAFSPFTKEVAYKTRDREEYTQTVDTASFNADWLVRYEDERHGYDSCRKTLAQLKVALNKWLDSSNLRKGVVSITWKKEEKADEDTCTD